MSAMKRLTVSLIGFWQINKYDLEVTGAIALATTVEELRDQYAEGRLRSGAWDKLHTLLGIEEKDVEKDTGTIIQDMVAKELDLEAIEKAHFVMPEKEKDIATLNPYKVAKKRDARVKIVEVEEFVPLINSELTIEQYYDDESMNLCITACDGGPDSCYKDSEHGRHTQDIRQGGKH